MPSQADRQYLRILHLAASTSEAEVELALRLLLEEDCVPSFDAVRELAGQAKPAAVPLIGPARIDLTGYDALLASRSAHA